MDALWRVDLIIHVGGAVQVACKVKITLGELSDIAVKVSLGNK